MGVIATDTYDKSTQIFDKDNILDVTDIKFYSDYDCTNEVDFFIENSIYYAEVMGVNHGDSLNLNYQILVLTFQSGNNHCNTTASYIKSDGSSYRYQVYKVTFYNFSQNEMLNSASVSITDSFGTTQNFSILINKPLLIHLLVTNKINEVYLFNDVGFNGSNYIAVGEIYPGSDMYYDALIVKFDNVLNIVDTKIYGNSNNEDTFNSIAVNNYYPDLNTKHYMAVGTAESNALIVKFDNNLNIMAAKTYGGTNYDYFYSVVIDNNGDYIAVGSTSSESQGYYDALIVKFDSYLNKIAAKTYGGTGDNEFNSVVVDNDGNYIAVGYTSFEGQGNDDGLIVKFDESLSNAIAAKTYGGTGDDYFKSVAIDNISSGGPYYIAVGSTSSESQGYDDALIVKFNNDLNIMAAKTYGGTGDDKFYSVAVDNTDPNNLYYIATGFTGSAGQGNYDASIVKFDSNLNIITAKIYGANTTDIFTSIIVDDKTKTYVTVGELNDGMIGKFYELPSGTFSATNDSSYIFADLNLTLTDITLSADFSIASVTGFTLADSNLSLNDSSLPTLTSSYTKNIDVVDN